MDFLKSLAYQLTLIVYTGLIVAACWVVALREAKEKKAQNDGGRFGAPPGDREV